MEIIVEGHKIDTKDIWKIELLNVSRYEGLVIGVVDKPDLVFKEYTDNLYSHSQREVRDKYKRMEKALNEKWELDKSDLQVFKL